MLINSLHASDFRKYKDLKVDDLPEKGVISVGGPNESGKTSIGEAICFALFGRTFVLKDENLVKLVRWGKYKAEVTLSFLDNSNQQYVLTRSVDRDVCTHVALHKIDDENSLNLTDAEDVRQALKVILGFDYEAFANSFYLVQRELTAPDPNSDTIKQMAGIGDYARIYDELALTKLESDKKLHEVEPQCAELEAQIGEINLDETWLPDLVEADETLESEQYDKAQLIERLKNDVENYSQNKKPFIWSQRLTTFAGIISMLLIPIILVSWLLWSLLRYAPETISKLTRDVSPDVIASYSKWADSGLIALAIVSLIALIAVYLFKRKHKAKMRLLNEDAGTFSEDLESGYRHVTTEVETLMPERVVQLIQERSETQQTLLVLPPREQFSNIGQLIETTENYQALTDELRAAVGRIEDVLLKQEVKINSHRASLQADINAEKERSDAAGELRSQLKKLSRVVDACKHNIKVQDTATEMLKRAARESTELFNTNIAKISARALPKFTEGRYHKVKIDENLNVQVFSDEKEGYMDFDEISSGTQRQIMLALRLAMSEELARNSGNETQFIFLDEPFAFFDYWRTKSTLQALPEVSDVITQVWVVAQDFPDEADIDKVIECPLDEEVLAV